MQIKQLLLKKNYIILFVSITVILILTVIINLNLPEKKEKILDANIEVIKGPDAPLSDKIHTQEIKSDSLQNIRKIIFSPDGKNLLAMSSPSDGNGYKLSLLDQEYKVKEDIEAANLLDARFNTNNQIYYQKAGDDYGIFTYLLNSGEKKKLVETSDNDYFNDIAFIDENRYFFIQPKTGKFGYGEVNTGTTNITGQKAEDNPSITDENKALYSDPQISENRKSLFIVDKSSSPAVKAFSVKDQKLNTPIFSVKIKVDYKNNYKIQRHGKYLVIGQDSLIIDMDNLTIVYRSESTINTKADISPDQTNFSLCEGIGKFSCYVSSIKNQGQKTQLPENISWIGWADNQNLILVIGKSIYNYDLNTQKLTKVFKEEGNYAILERNDSDNSLIISKNNILFNLTVNK